MPTLTYNTKAIIVSSDLNNYKKYVITIVSNDIKAQGLVYVFNSQVYVICSAHILNNNNIYLNGLFKNVNNSSGDKILRLQTIGFERATDIAVLLYIPSQNAGFILDPNYYSGISFNSTPLYYNMFYYIICSISDMSDITIQNVDLKNPMFYGDIEHLLPPSVLVEGNILKGSSGGPVFDANGNFIGIASSNIRDTNMNQIVNTAMVDLIFYIVYENWQIFGPKLTNIYDLGNYLKRSVRFAFLGVDMKQYDIIMANTNYYLTMENFREGLPDIQLRKTGGILITNFIHGYNNIDKAYVYTPFQPIYTGFKIDNPFKNANMYKNFYTFNTGPVVLVSIEYYDSVAHYKDYKKTGINLGPKAYYVKNYLGKYSEQQSIYEFILRVGWVDVVEYLVFHKDPFTLQPVPFIIEYLYNNGKTWNYDKESVLPFPVAYLDENNHEVRQYSIENPYPLYGADIIMPGKDKYIPLDLNIVSKLRTTQYISGSNLL